MVCLNNSSDAGLYCFDYFIQLWVLFVLMLTHPNYKKVCQEELSSSEISGGCMGKFLCSALKMQVCV